MLIILTFCFMIYGYGLHFSPFLSSDLKKYHIYIVFLLNTPYCNMYGVYLFNMFTKFLLTQILEILMVNKLL